MVNDYYFNVEYQRFIAGMAGTAPDDAITEVLATALSDTRLGLTQIRRLAQRFAVDVSEEPAPATVGLAAYLQAQLTRGYGLSLTGLYAAEQVYFHAWSAVRPQADRSTPVLAADRPLVQPDVRDLAGLARAAGGRDHGDPGDAAHLRPGDPAGAAVPGRAADRRRLVTSW